MSLRIKSYCKEEDVSLPRVLEVREAAKLSGYAEMTLYRAMERGLLKSIRLTGKKRSIRLEDLRAWLNGETQPTAKGSMNHSKEEVGKIISNLREKAPEAAAALEKLFIETSPNATVE